MQFISSILAYTENQPFTGDVNKVRTAASVPTWFTQSTLHVAKVIRTGPYADPSMLFVVGANQLMVEFEAPQPDPGTLQAEENPRPHWYAILDINRTFVTTGSMMDKIVNPLAAYAPGDKVAAWFNITNPAQIVGKYRPPSGPGANQMSPRPMPGMLGF